jgi:hypothetical protein
MRDQIVAAIARAVAVFQGGYGDGPDLEDAVDRAAFVPLLADELAVAIEREVASRLRARYKVEADEIREMFDSQIEAWGEDPADDG